MLNYISVVLRLQDVKHTPVMIVATCANNQKRISMATATLNIISKLFSDFIILYAKISRERIRGINSG